MYQDSDGQSKLQGDEVASYDIYDDCLVIRLNTELDHHSALEIRKSADKLIDRMRIQNIIFDFSNAYFMDSAGIGVIMGRYKKVGFQGGKTAVTNVNPSIDRILRISGLYKIIRPFSNIEDALKELKSGNV